jgi:hypothetical protein
MDRIWLKEFRKEERDESIIALLQYKTEWTEAANHTTVHYKHSEADITATMSFTGFTREETIDYLDVMAERANKNSDTIYLPAT